MARGGTRSGAGRKPGSANVKTREIADKAAQAGITPLEVMLEAMHQCRDKGDIEKAAYFAKDAAPYIHARLANVDAKVEGEMGLTIEIVRHADDPTAE